MICLQRRNGIHVYQKKDLKPFVSKVWLVRPTIDGEELKYIIEGYETNWMSTVGDDSFFTEYRTTN